MALLLKNGILLSTYSAGYFSSLHNVSCAFFHVRTSFASFLLKAVWYGEVIFEKAKPEERVMLGRQRGGALRNRMSENKNNIDLPNHTS